MLRIVFLFVMRIGQGMVLPIRKCKDSERRVQKQMGNEVSRIDSAEPTPILSKDSERRVQKQMETNVFDKPKAEPNLFELC